MNKYLGICNKSGSIPVLKKCMGSTKINKGSTLRTIHVLYEFQASMKIVLF